jgi:predicted nuclease with RNAse H fold
MVHYVGLDVSLKQTSICVVNETGFVVREGAVASDPEAIAAFVRSKALGLDVPLHLEQLADEVIAFAVLRLMLME